MRLARLGGLLLLPVLAAGCGEDAADRETVAPNRALRAVVEKPAPVVEPKEARRFGYDARGHLSAAEKLVNGFEVPIGLELVKRNEAWLEFQIKAPIEDLFEFYNGVDQVSKLRFAERGYGLERGKKGFSVRHTRTSLNRLGIKARYEKAHVFVAHRLNQWQTVRVHTVPEERTAEENPYVPRVNFEDRSGSERAPAPSPRNGPVSENTGPASPTTAGGARRPERERAPEPAPDRARPVPVAPDGPSAADHMVPAPTEGPRAGKRRTTGSRRVVDQPAAWGPYKRGALKDPKPKIRQWLQKNPGKVFLD